MPHLLGPLQDRDLNPSLEEIVRHLEPDESSAYYDGTLHVMGVDPLLDPSGVGDGTYRVDAGEVDAREGRLDRSST